MAVQSPWVSTEQELGVKADLEGVLQEAMLAPLLLPPPPWGTVGKAGLGYTSKGLGSQLKGQRGVMPRPLQGRPASPHPNQDGELSQGTEHLPPGVLAVLCKPSHVKCVIIHK